MVSASIIDCLNRLRENPRNPAGNSGHRIPADDRPPRNRMLPSKKLSFILLLSFLCGNLLLAPICNLHAAGGKQIMFAADHPPYLKDFVMRSRDGEITLSLRVANPFDHELKSLISNGVPQKIRLSVKVQVNRFNLYLVKFNQEIHSTVHIHTISYDNLKKIFTVDLGQPRKPLETPSYKEAIRLATNFRNLTILKRNQIDPERSYQVETRAEIRKARLPFHLEYLFFFLSAWDRKSNCYTIDIPERLINETLER